MTRSTTLHARMREGGMQFTSWIQMIQSLHSAPLLIRFDRWRSYAYYSHNSLRRRTLKSGFAIPWGGEE